MQRPNSHSEGLGAEARLAALVALSDRVRGVSDPAEVIDAGVEVLGRYCNARCSYVEIGAGGAGAAGRFWQDGQAGVLDTEPFGPALTNALSAGGIVRVDGAQADALLAVPLFSGERLEAIMSVRGGSRHWRDDEVALAGEVAERTFNAVRRVRAEAALPASEARYRAFVHASAHVVWRMSADGRRLLEATGPGRIVHAADAGPSESWLLDYVHPDERAGVLAAWTEAVRSGSVYEREVRGRRADRTWGWMIARAVPVRGADGNVTEWVGTITDITQRKNAEADARALQAALAGSLAAMAQLHEISTRLTASSDLAALLDTALSGVMELQGADHGSIQLYDHAAGLLQLVAHRNVSADFVARFGTVRAGETLCAHALQQGRRVIVADTAAAAFAPGNAELARMGIRAAQSTPLLDHAGRPLGIMSTHFDAPHEFPERILQLTDLYARQIANVLVIRLGEEALRASEARQRLLSETIPHLLWTAEAGGLWVGSSPQWRAYTGLCEEDSLGKGWIAAIHPDDRTRGEAAWSEASATGEGLDLELRLRRHDGVWRWFQMRARPFREGSAAPRWFGTCTDIDDLVRAREVLARGRAELESLVAERTASLQATIAQLHAEVLERQQAEQALRQSQKMEAIGQLTGGIAHDFNNMLQAIASSLETIERRMDQGRPADIGRFIGIARKACARAAGLTNRLLAFARRQALDARPLDPNALVRGMEELIRRTLGPGAHVQVDAGLGIWTVLCDPNQLESAVLNLCINARDALEGDGLVTISTRNVRLSAGEVAGEEGAEPGEFVEIAVSDTGAGMEPRVLARALEPFFTTKPVGQGTGLGLSQIYGFVRQSGGLMRLQSAPGAGTTVRVYLPRHHELPAEATPPASAQVATGSGTVLLVEDEAPVRATLAERLRELGYSVREAEDGPAALRTLQSGERPDLLVTDVGLPGGLNGRQVAEAARARWPELRVLFITGYAGAALQNRLERGTEVIRKPFTLDALAARVHAILSESSIVQAD